MHRKTKNFLLVICGIALLSCCKGKSQLENDLYKYFNGNVPRHKISMTDLNYDGLKDAVLYLNDSEWCGTGGCTLMVFKNNGDNFKHLSTTTLITPPIKYSNSANSIFKTLIGQTKGVGEVALHFDKKYPLNPSALPKISDMDKDHAVIIIR